ncbi:MAG: clan AA aspartic protease [Flavobacteriaceae bacterium]|nr:retroviral-like aspartic protease family protein [Bacteroidia bacterium]NNL61304.1 clan AA aspartic protease [Flavobacteriaceae bacterium]
MTNKLGEYLLDQGYKKIKLHFTRTNHFRIGAKINGIKGRFIVDTGASNSCIGFDEAEQFKLISKDSDILAAGAGSTDMETKVSEDNTVRIGNWKKDKVVLVLFNLSHVNTALVNHESEPVDGIIGADILKKGRAVIDYGKNYLYLK